MKKYLGALLLLAVAFAVDRPLAMETPAEKIVRASFVQGETSYQRGDADDWSALGVNTPLMTGDSLYTARGARAEVSLGRGNFARMSDDAQIDLVSMTAEVTQLGISSGSLSLRVRTLPEGSVIEVDSPSATATIRAPGLYRISVDDRHARYEVISGGLAVVLGGEQLDVGPNESLALEGAETPTYEYTGLRPAGAFDGWVTSRDQRFEGTESVRHVHPEVEGNEDLDSHGTWRPHPVYGSVWVPAGMRPDWAPYQDGRWVWQDPYGWTWVSYESWGWAPYHYGRWVSLSGTWAWVPPPPVGYAAPAGVIMPEPVYAPALVAFIGGSHWSVGVSVGGGSNVGWVPLAPAERYYYPWQPAPRVTTHYTNITVVNSVTVVNQTNFVGGGGRRVKVSPRDLSNAPVMGCRPEGVAPTPESLGAYPRRHFNNGIGPRRREERRPLVAGIVPPPRPIPFKDKVEKIRTTGRPIERPIAFNDDVGKPFQKGVHVPQGVNAVSAIAPERPAGFKPARVAERGGKNQHTPRPMERAMMPAEEKSVAPPAAPADPATGEYERHAGKPERHTGAQERAEGESERAAGTPEPSGVAPEQPNHERPNHERPNPGWQKKSSRVEPATASVTDGHGIAGQPGGKGATPSVSAPEPPRPDSPRTQPPSHEARKGRVGLKSANSTPPPQPPPQQSRQAERPTPPPQPPPQQSPQSGNTTPPQQAPKAGHSTAPTQPEAKQAPKASDTKKKKDVKGEKKEGGGN